MYQVKLQTEIKGRIGSVEATFGSAVEVGRFLEAVLHLDRHLKSKGTVNDVDAHTWLFDYWLSTPEWAQ